jgi:PAS domain S-box-containing protein
MQYRIPHDHGDMLLESEQQFRTTLEAAPVGVGHVAPDGTWLFVNRKLCDIVGYTRDELLARTFHDITHPDDLAVDLAYADEVLAGTRESYSMEKRYIHKSGALVWINLTVSLARNSDGSPRYFISVVEDISARKQAEAVLAARQHRYRVIVEAAPHIMWLNHPDGTINFFNQRWYDFTGLSENTTVGLRWLAAVHQDDLAGIMETRSHAVAAGQTYRYEARIRQHDGMYWWHSVHVVPLRDDDGKLNGWLGTAIEVDARKRAEEGLHFLNTASAVLASSLDYETTLQHVAELAVPDLADWCAVYLLRDGEIERSTVHHNEPQKLAVVDELYRRYGIRDGIRGVIARRQPLLLAQFSEEQLAAAAEDEEHLRLLRQLGLVSMMIVPMIVREAVCGVLVFASANPQRRYDTIDLSLATDIASRAAQAIDNARLYQSAQTAIREREAYVSIASHELKTPLAALLGHAQLLQRRYERFGPSERDQRNVRVIVEQGQRLHAMLDALLDVSRLDSGQVALKRVPIELSSLVARMVEEAQSAHPHHAFRFNAQTTFVTVEGDALRLEQVFRNLLGNAAKYSPRGSPVEVRINLDGADVHIDICDQGIGIPEGALPHLFERFYRVDSINTRDIKGFGIGLYVVREIVNLHGGTVSVASEEGHGSVFTVCLPRLHAAHAEVDVRDVAVL